MLVTQKGEITDERYNQECPLGISLPMFPAKARHLFVRNLPLALT